jgi:RNA polymerase sigma-70 factor (ECF subfamily)
VNDPASDVELLTAWGNGDLSAGQLLLDRHFASLYRFLRNKVDDEGLRDLMQQVWLSCVEARARFRHESSFRTFLLQIARRQLYAYSRARHKWAQMDLSISSVAALGSSPSQLLGRGQERRILLEALRRIPLDHQLVIELRFWEDMSGGEIAEVLGIPEPTLRGRLQRATARLRSELLALIGHPTSLLETADDLHAWASRMRDALA